MVIAWSEVNRRKLTIVKRFRNVGVTTKKLLHGIVMVLGLNNAVAPDWTELANGAIDWVSELTIFGNEWPCVRFQWPREELIEGRISARIFFNCFAHVNVVFTHKPLGEHAG